MSQIENLISEYNLCTIMIGSCKSYDEFEPIIVNYFRVLKHRQLVVSIPRLSVPSCHLLGKINVMGTFFSIRHLCLYQNG